MGKMRDRGTAKPGERFREDMTGPELVDFVSRLGERQRFMLSTFGRFRGLGATKGAAWHRAADSWSEGIYRGLVLRGFMEAREREIELHGYTQKVREYRMHERIVELNGFFEQVRQQADEQAAADRDAQDRRELKRALAVGRSVGCDVERLSRAIEVERAHEDREWVIQAAEAALQHLRDAQGALEALKERAEFEQAWEK